MFSNNHKNIYKYIVVLDFKIVNLKKKKNAMMF